MKLAAIELVGMFLAFFILAAVFVIPVVLMILCIRALWLYIKTHARAQEVKKETAAVRKTLSETLKDHRTRCKMTQEFVAESTMSNLVLLAQLYGVTLAELLENVI